MSAFDRLDSVWASFSPELRNACIAVRLHAEQECAMCAAEGRVVDVTPALVAAALLLDEAVYLSAVPAADRAVLETLYAHLVVEL